MTLWKSAHSSDARANGVRSPAAASIALAAIIGLASPAALATHVDDPEVEKGEKEVKISNEARAGLPRTRDVPRQELAVHLGYGLTDFFAVELLGTGERSHDDRLELSAAGVETTLQFLKSGGDGIAAAWLTAVEFGTRSGDTNTLVFGPVLKATSGPFSIVTNSFLEKTFGRNREDGIDFTYVVQALHTLPRGFAVGLEIDGTVPHLADPPPLSEQEHSAGPILFKTFELADKRQLKLGVGAFFGLTEASAELTVRSQVKLNW